MSDRNQSLTLSKGLSVLSCFETGQRDLTMADVARLVGLDRAVARRLCLTLEADGFLSRDGKFLRLTPKVLALAGGYLRSEHIGRSVQPVLNQFAEDLNGEITLAVLSGHRAVYVARSAVGSARLSLGLSVGSTLPLWSTAVGRMLLAACDPQTRQTLLRDAPPQVYTKETQTDPDILMNAIEDTARQGFAYVTDQFEIGAAGLAVSAPALSGCPAVLATSAAAHVFSPSETRQEVIQILLAAAHCLRGAY